MIPSLVWRECIKKVWKVDPLPCVHCGGELLIFSSSDSNQCFLLRRVTQQKDPVWRRGGKDSRRVWQTVAGLAKKHCEIEVEQLGWRQEVEQIRQESRFFRAAVKISCLLLTLTHPMIKPREPYSLGGAALKFPFYTRSAPATVTNLESIKGTTGPECSWSWVQQKT